MTPLGRLVFTSAFLVLGGVLLLTYSRLLGIG